MSISSSFALFMGGGFLQDHLIIVSHARKDFGFLSSSSVVKASQLGRKMGIYLRSGRTPQAAQKSRFRRVARLTEGRFGVGYRSPCYPAAFPAPFPPSLIRGGRLHVIKLRDRRPGEEIPPPSLCSFSYIPVSGSPIHPLCKVPLILIPLSYTCDKSRPLDGGCTVLKSHPRRRMRMNGMLH